MQVIIQVSTDVALKLHQRAPPASETESLLRVIVALGLTLQPMHPHTNDPNLQRYFIVEVLDHATAQQVMDRLRQVQAVEAAYVKPQDESP
ncbi:MAG: hypothetical protein AB7G48_18700 [Nitrospiraceae bacterium]